MNADIIWKLALDRQAGLRQQARLNALARSVKTRHAQPRVVPGREGTDLALRPRRTLSRWRDD